MQLLRLHGGRDAVTDIPHVRLSLSSQDVIALVLKSVVAHSTVITLSDKVGIFTTIVTGIHFVVSQRVSVVELICRHLHNIWRQCMCLTLDNVHACHLLLVRLEHSARKRLTEFSQRLVEV